MNSEELLIQFGFFEHKTRDAKDGYLLNYNRFSNNDGIFYNLYFLSNEYKFFIKQQFFPSFVLESKDLEILIEVIKREFSHKIYDIKIIEKIDTTVKNHLNIKPKEYAQVYFFTEFDFNNAVTKIRKITKNNQIESKVHIQRDSNQKMSMNKVFTNKLNLNKTIDILNTNNNEEATLENLVTAIHEFDIPFDITFATDLNIRCGKFYNVNFLDEKYYIKELELIVPPEISIFAFDIETTKKPLQFPNPEFDEIMMISIMTNNMGILITNSEIISEYVNGFEYKIEGRNDAIYFEVFNEENEEKLLIKFVEMIYKYKPEIITTYNGDFFDIPFLETRMKKIHLDFSINNIIHLDCFKWVKRDSYLPMGSQGLKAVTKIKLGYIPDEIDPEEMMNYAKTQPKTLAAYSVSDSIATYNLYMKYVHPFIFSLCTLIPLKPYDVLSKGSGTLCEALLIAESKNYQILIPIKKVSDNIFYEDKFCEEINYIGGHVECLKSGIYRSDFEYEFSIEKERLDEMIIKSKNIYNDSEIQNVVNNELNVFKDRFAGNQKIYSKPLIYHLDVSAMYPNIILTNRLQPISVINKDTCINCDFYEEENNCQRKMKWNVRLEYIPATKKEIRMLNDQLIKTKTGYKELNDFERNKILKTKAKEYSRQIYKKSTQTEIFEMENTVCQREIPFYVDIVKKFRDRRYVYKRKFNDIKKEYENIKNDTDKTELDKKLIVFESLQVAHKCILNSFYGYVMRRGARWYSMEMAAIVCHTGANIIKTAKEFVDDIGITLELDTDGIWCLVPDTFPVKITTKNGKSYNFLCDYMNYLIQEKFTNEQYQEKDGDKYTMTPYNQISFEIDGPYKAMILPSSTEEGKLIKKKYVVINRENKICELKGFETKRRGELKIVKKFQEELFPLFSEGKTLKECYEIIAEHCQYYMDLIDSKGEFMHDDDIFDLFSESKNMSKLLKEYNDRKLTSTTAATRLSEFLGVNVLDEKGLKCEFIISKYPENKAVTERVIPVQIFKVKNEIKNKMLKKWLGVNVEKLKDLVDWVYYKERLVNSVLRIVLLPSISQGIKNLLTEIKLPDWAKGKKNKNIFDYNLIKQPKNIFTNDDFTKIDEKEESEQEKENFIKREYGKYLKKTKMKWKKNIDKFANFKILDIGESTLRYTFGNKIKEQKYTNDQLFFIEYQNSKYISELKTNSLISKIEAKEVLINNINKNCLQININKNIFHNNQLKINYLLSNLSIKNMIIRDNEFDRIIAFESMIASKKYYKGNIYKKYIIMSFNFSSSKFFIVFDGSKNIILTENKDYSSESGFIITSLKNYLKSLKEDIKIFFLSKLDKNAQYIKDSISGLNLLYASLDLKFPVLFANLKSIIQEYNRLAFEFFDQIEAYEAIQHFYNIPIINLCNMNTNQFLNFLFYKKLNIIDSNIKNAKTGSLIEITNSFSQKGYYKTFSMMLEIKNSFILSILEYKEFILENSDYDLTENLEFQCLRELVKEYYNFADNMDSNKNNHFQKTIYKNLIAMNKYIKESQDKISDTLKKNIIELQQNYILFICEKIKELGGEIILLNKEIIILNTNKKTYSGLIKFYDYLQEKLELIKGTEMLNLAMLCVYERIAIVDELNFYYIPYNDGTQQIYSYRNAKLAKDFLKSFFEEKITNNYFYDLVISKKYRNKESIKNMLNIYETTKNIDNVRSSCYEVLKLSIFKEKNHKKFSFDIFCDHCNIENILILKEHISLCYKCGEIFGDFQVDKKIFEVVLYELKNYKITCERCNDIKKSKLQSNCHCGGYYVKTQKLDDIYQLIEYLRTDIYKNKTKKILKTYALESNEIN